MGRGSTAAAASPHVTAVGLLGCAEPTTLPVAATMLTVYVSPEGGVDRMANVPARGTGEVAGEAPGEGVDDALALADGELIGELAPFAEGDAPGCELGPPQPPTSTATANHDVNIFTWRTS
jgi:hypothetical protein